MGWVLGTVIGVLIGGALGDPKTYGLDALFPAFFVALLYEEVHGTAQARGSVRRSGDRTGPHSPAPAGPPDPDRGRRCAWRPQGSGHDRRLGHDRRAGPGHSGA